jgi:hypothetical protein
MQMETVKMIQRRETDRSNWMIMAIPSPYRNLVERGIDVGRNIRELGLDV